MVTELTIHPFEKIAGHLPDDVRAAIKGRLGLLAAIGREMAAPAQAYPRARMQCLSPPFLDLQHLSSAGDSTRQAGAAPLAGRLNEPDCKRELTAHS